MDNNFVIFEGNSILNKELIWTGSKKFNPGDIVLELTGTILKWPTRTSIQISENEHIESYLGRFVNHNCNPNCKVENKCLIAIKEIKENDSITFNYNISECELANSFKCNCCKKLIVGNKYKKNPLNNNLKGEWYNNTYE